jgi:hypothetical protein
MFHLMLRQGLTSPEIASAVFLSRGLDAYVMDIRPGELMVNYAMVCPIPYDAYEFGPRISS